MGISTTRALFLPGVIAAIAACGVTADGDTGPGFDDTTDAVTASAALSAGHTNTVSFTNHGGLTTVTVNCAPSANPDAVGATFRVAAPDLGIASASSQPARDGYFSWTGSLAAGRHTLTLTGVEGSASCRVVTGNATTGTCGRFVWHSPNTNHTHFRVGSDTSADWEPFPTSGNHWGAWPTWNTVYTRPVRHGFLLHALEHGGVVLSYNCSGPTQSTQCRQAHDALAALAQQFGRVRVIVTPDPSQPQRFALRAWRWGYSSDCLDASAALSFLRVRYRQGREDTDANPPIPYDPSTTNVPCQDLMAAPDSC